MAPRAVNVPKDEPWPSPHSGPWDRPSLVPWVAPHPSAAWGRAGLDRSCFGGRAPTASRGQTQSGRGELSGQLEAQCALSGETGDKATRCVLRALSP